MNTGARGVSAACQGLRAGQPLLTGQPCLSRCDRWTERLEGDQ